MGGVHIVTDDHDLVQLSPDLDHFTRVLEGVPPRGGLLAPLP
ncbi:hypothetical protein ACH4SK_07885 [Streptomyces inhibens]